MGLLQNKSIHAQYPLRQTGGLLFSNRVNFGPRLANNNNKFIGEASIDYKTSIPLGYNVDGAFFPAMKSGGMAMHTASDGVGTLSFGNLAGGLNAESTLNGYGSITNAAMGLIVQLVATLQGLGTFNADISGKLEATATLAGSGNISGAIGALAGLIATLNGSSSLTVAGGAGTPVLGNMSATISPFTTLSPENLANKVWNSVAATFNNAGTMGEKLNDAGSAGNPWSTAVSGNMDAGTFGEAVGKKLLKKNDFIALK